jgi:hypothetical protein
MLQHLQSKIREILPDNFLKQAHDNAVVTLIDKNGLGGI